MAAEKSIKRLTDKNGRCLLALIFAVFIGCLTSALKPSSLITSARAAIGPSLQIGNYVLISKRKASQNEFDYTYQASASNTGTAAAFDLKAKADSLNPAIKLKNPNLKFGDVAVGASVPSRDTFTLRKLESTAFKPTDLTWRLDAKFAPTANAGPDQSVTVGDTVYLDGSASGNDDDDEDEPLSYQWTILSKPAGSNAALINATRVNPTFVADVTGSYSIQLVVRQEDRISAPDIVVINTTNSAPVADAGADQTVSVGNLAVLNGSASSDADNDPLTYKWTITNKPTNSTATLLNPTSVKPSFTVDKPGIYSVQLIVNDGSADSEAAITLVTTLNARPVANAGLDQAARVNAVATLDGSASSDVDGDPITYT